MGRTRRMEIRNTTALSTDRLEALIRPYEDAWACRELTVLIRYSRGADFSGTCFYGKRRVHINIGRHVRYPYAMSTYLAKAKSNRRYWWKEDYIIEIADGYELAMFIFLHELYHWLIKKARRNRRQKESMCDRFAARELVDRFGCPIRDSRGRPVPREAWDFQNLDGFVAAARLKLPAAPKPRPAPKAARTALPPGAQLPLFADP